MLINEQNNCSKLSLYILHISPSMTRQKIKTLNIPFHIIKNSIQHMYSIQCVIHVLLHTAHNTNYIGKHTTPLNNQY